MQLRLSLHQEQALSLLEYILVDPVSEISSLVFTQKFSLTSFCKELGNHFSLETFVLALFMKLHILRIQKTKNNSKILYYFHNTIYYLLFTYFVKKAANVQK